MTLGEPDGGGTTTRWHVEPLERLIRCVEGDAGVLVLVDGDLMKGRDDVEQEGEGASFTQGIADPIDTGGGEPPEGADSVNLRVIDGDTGASTLVGDEFCGAGVWRSRMIDEAGGQEPVEDIIDLFGGDDVDAIWPGGDGGMTILNGIRAHEPIGCYTWRRRPGTHGQHHVTL